MYRASTLIVSGTSHPQREDSAAVNVNLSPTEPCGQSVSGDVR